MERKFCINEETFEALISQHGNAFRYFFRVLKFLKLVKCLSVEIYARFSLIEGIFNNKTPLAINFELTDVIKGLEEEFVTLFHPILSSVFRFIYSNQ